MSSAPSIFAELYLPLILAVTCIVGLLRTRKGEKHTLIKLKPFGDFVDYHVEISNAFVIRSFLVIGAFAFLSAYLLYDYSKFFPQHYQMEVFYDERGIAQSLKEFTAAEIASLSIPRNTAQYRERYFKQLDVEVRKVLGTQEFYSVKQGYTHSSGSTFIVVEKMGGWQNYHVVESQGELTHILEVPDHPPRQFYTRFEKLASEDDYISLTISDLFVRRRIMLRTRYKQILVENSLSAGFLFKLSLVGITKVTIFPWPHVSNTVYLARFENVGLVPVAYAIYR